MACMCSPAEAPGHWWSMEGRKSPSPRLQPGDWFGETALLDRTTRTATVRASEPVSALWLDRVVFDALLEFHPEIRGAFGNQARVEMLHRFLRTHAAFEDLSLEAASAMYPELRSLDVPAQTVLVREGEPGRTMYLVEHGRLEATTAEGDTQRSIGFMRTGDIFGERSLVTGEPCIATVRAVTEVRLLALDREAFQDLAGRFPAFARRVNEQAAGRNYREEARVPLDFAKEILPGGISEVPAPSALQVETPTPIAEGRRRSRHRRRFPVILQVDEADCGVACLAMIAAWHGIDVSLSWLRESPEPTSRARPFARSPSAGGWSDWTSSRSRCRGTGSTTSSFRRSFTGTQNTGSYLSGSTSGVPRSPIRGSDCNG